MLGSERIQAAFEKRSTDKVPIHHIGFSSSVASQILKHEAYVGGGIQQWREARSYWEGWHDEFLERSFRDALEIASVTEQDIVRPSFWRFSLKPTRRIDDYTFLYEYGKEEEWRVLRYDPKSEQANIFYFKQRELTIEDIKKHIEDEKVQEYIPKEENYEFEIKAQRALKGEKAVRVGGIGIGLPLRDTTVWLEAMLIDSELIKGYIELQVERARENVEFLANHGFRYFFGGGDFASEQGPMYSPKLFKKLILPGLKKVSLICHKRGVYHLFGSDGDLWPVADMLFGESEIDGEYEIDRKAGMYLNKLRERFPRLTLIGNISSHTLHCGTREEVRKETISCIESAKKYRGIIVGVSNYIVPGTPLNNVMVMLETLKNYR